MCTVIVMYGSDSQASDACAFLKRVKWADSMERAKNVVNSFVTQHGGGVLSSSLGPLAHALKWFVEQDNEDKPPEQQQQLRCGGGQCVDVEMLVFHYSATDVTATCVVLQILPDLPSLMHRVLVQLKRVLPLRFQTGNSVHRCITLRLSELRQWLLELGGLEQTKEVVHDRGVVMESIDRLVQKLAARNRRYAGKKEADPDGLHPSTHTYAAQKEAAPDGVHPRREPANALYAAKKEADPDGHHPSAHKRAAQKEAAPDGVHPSRAPANSVYAATKLAAPDGVHSQVALDNVLQATHKERPLLRLPED
jgi:hypothetical protein